MDILNFIYWIRNKRVINQAPPKSLIPIGVKLEGRDDKYISCAIPIEDLGIGTGGGNTSGKYRMEDFPETTIPKTDYDPTILGKAFEDGGYVRFPSPWDYLEDGTLVNIYYCDSILESGIMIFEAYTIEVPLDGISGYWLAYKEDPNDSSRLIKVGELKMTQQIWDNWYRYTAKDSGPNTVKFVEMNAPSLDSTNLEAFITKLTWTGSALVAEDIYFNYGGNTVLSLYTSLTGITPVTTTWAYLWPESILDDDYYGMAMGDEAGWMYYRNTNTTPDEQWIIVGFNVLTGQTKWVNIPSTMSAITNMTPLLPYENLIVNWYNHPAGITVAFKDGDICDQGNNYKGVTALWSPYWTDITKCLYVGIRGQDPYLMERLCVGGFFNVKNYYWDNEAWYFVAEDGAALNRDQVFIVHKLVVKTKETVVYTMPFTVNFDDIAEDVQTVLLQAWSNNDGIFYSQYQPRPLSFSISNWNYLKHADKVLYGLHLDPSYPTHAMGNRVYNIITGATYNTDTLGVVISNYKNITF